jgi:hypothetical protein
MGIGLDDNDIPQARVHMKGPVKIEGSLEVTERLHYKGRINETVGDASTPRVLEETNETPFGNPFGDKISYTFTKATRVMIEANLPFLNGNCTAKVALCYKIGSGSETIIDEAVITVSTSVHNRLKLSGYLNIPENTTVEFYTKIVARESGEVRLNSDSDSLKQFNCFGTIQLIEI